MELKNLQALDENELEMVEGGRLLSEKGNYKYTNILKSQLFNKQLMKYCCPTCSGSLNPLTTGGKTTCTCDSCKIVYTVYEK